MTPERFRLSSLGASMPSDPLPLWRRLLALGARLPGGLVRADRITIVPKAPEFLVPLAPGSRWCAMGQGLVVTAELETDGVQTLLQDLQMYRGFAQLIRERLGAWPQAAILLEQERMPAELAVPLAEIFEASPAELATLDRRAPGLRADVAWMVRRPFDPELSLHPALSEPRQRALGEELAQTVLNKIPAGRFHLLVSDGPGPLELLSPYAEDLGHSLYQWALENTDKLPFQGLADDLKTSRDTPDRELASLVARVLLQAEDDEIRVERRENEVTQGLWLEDAWGATWGVADLGRLDRADSGVRRHETDEVLAVITGGSAALRLAAAGHLAASGRIEGLAICADTALVGASPIVPEALSWSDDAIRLELGGALARFAQRTRISVQRLGAVDVGPSGVPDWVAGVLRRWRKARITGALDAQAKPLVVLVPACEVQSVQSAKVGINAGRLALSGLLDPDLMSHAGAQKSRTGARTSGVSRRFRA